MKRTGKNDIKEFALTLKWKSARQIARPEDSNNHRAITWTGSKGMGTPKKVGATLVQRNSVVFPKI